MSQSTITVSDGENFFRIPLSDLPEAAADGFYVPALAGRTIVTDGEEMFEIVVEDLAEAQADGFRDALAGEHKLLNEARRQLGGERSDASDASEQSPSTRDQVLTADSTATGRSEELDTVGQSEMRNRVPPPESEDSGLKPQVKEDREDVGSAIGKFLLPGGQLSGGKTWQVLLVNTVLHGLVLLVLAAIILPAPDGEIFMEITSAFEPKDPVKMEFEAVELTQPEQLKSDPIEMEVMNLFEVENDNNVEIDVNDLEVNIPEVVPATDVANGPQPTNATGEMGGRSKVGRAAAVARRGGSSASEAAVTAGLVWLTKHQYPDGGWSYDHSLGECGGQCSQPGTLSVNCRNAATGMALLALLGAGNTPYDGEFQESVRNGIGFLLQNSTGVPAGLDMRSKHDNNTGMYTQAIAATALCEVLAMTEHNIKAAGTDRKLRSNNRRRTALIMQLRPAAQASISFIVNAQHQPTGGWGYNPGTAGDTSILGWQIMALKSAVHAQIPVPGNTVLGANTFLTSVQTADGYFGYRTPEKKPSTTAIGIIARMLSGMKRDNSILQMGVNHLSARGPDKSNMYYNYYATQVMLHYGGEKWQKWNAVMRDHLVATQIKEGHESGSWGILNADGKPADAHGARAGRLYMTCLCTMTLEVYYRHLPLYGDSAMAEADLNSGDQKK
jgi:hypothetical protein